MVPAGISRSIPVSARVRPKRLASPWASTAGGSGGAPPCCVAVTPSTVAILVHMDKSSGQTAALTGLPGSRTPASGRTRSRLMTAAVELIAEVGWGRVTTRAVAERAGLPHGSVSYHFRGKQELLTEAALTAFQEAVPTDQVAAAASVDDLITLISTEVGGH